jgi:cell wall-associated NlpC family hydrolase
MNPSAPQRLRGDNLQRVLEAANRWIATPYHPGARLRGVGVDCAQILVAVYSEAGLMPAIDIGDYSIQVHLHKPVDEDGKKQLTRYVDTILQWANEIQEIEASPGDLVLYKEGYAFAHGAIIVKWPDVIIHAARKVGVIEAHGTNEGYFHLRPRRFFRIKHNLPSHSS